MSALQLPPMCDALLDEATLERLFVDWATRTQVLSVVEKAGLREYVVPASVDLGAAQTNLLLGRVRAVQVRYVWEEREWCDTLMRTPAGIRLVRVQAPVGE